MRRAAGTRRRGLSPTALSLLRRIGDLQRAQRSSRAFVHVNLVITSTSSAQWHALQLLSERTLITAVEPGIVRVTPSGWAYLRGAQRRSEGGKKT